MTYKIKYEPMIRGSQAKKGRSRRQTPELWLSGPDPVDHDKYYAWQKHKAQAKYRKEEYNLSWECWKEIWPNELFLQRGRDPENVCMIRLDLSQPWQLGNVEVVTRLEHLRTQKDRLK
jgi:hypothetical protein